MEFGEDDQLWNDLEQLTLESGTAALNTPTEFHRWNDLPTEILLLILHRMEFDSLMKLRGACQFMKTLVDSQIFDFDSVKCTHWITHDEELHFHVSTMRQGKGLDLALANELFDQEYGFVPYSHVLQFMQQVLKYGRTKVLDICNVPRHGAFERIDEEMSDFLDQLGASAPFRFSNFILDGISPPVAIFFLNNSEERVKTVQFYRDSPPDRPGASVDVTELLNESKFVDVPSIRIISLNNESYCQATVLITKKWLEVDAEVGQKLLVAKCLSNEPSEQDTLFQCFETEFTSLIIERWENKEKETGDLRIQMRDEGKQIHVKKVEAAVFCVIVPSSFRDSQVFEKFREEVEWLQTPMLQECFT